MSLPIKVRLTVWYTTLLALILVAFGAFLFLRLKSELTQAVDQSLESRAAQITLGYQGSPQSNFQDVSDASLRSLAPGETAAQRLSPMGSVLDATGDPTVTDRPMIGVQAIAAALQGHERVASVTLGSDGEAFRVLVLRLARPGGASVLVVASSLEEVGSSVHRLLILFATGIPVALLLAGLGGWLITRKALLPVARMTAEAQEIGADRLEDRIAIPPTADELQRLAATLNDMLGRLQDRRLLQGHQRHEDPGRVLEWLGLVGRAEPRPWDAQQRACRRILPLGHFVHCRWLLRQGRSQPNPCRSVLLTEVGSMGPLRNPYSE